jgi:hypothetical protein
MLFDACAAIDKGGCGGIGCGCGAELGREPICQMISVCARETTLGRGMVWVLIIALIGVVFHGPHGRGHTSLLHKGTTAAPDCTGSTCNPVNFTVLKPSDWTWGHIIGIKTDKKGLDPEILMCLKVVTITRESSSYQVSHSFYEEMRSRFSTSSKAKNLFLSLLSL